MARPWYAFYPADYERKTAHLSLLEHGAYRRLMDHYYSTGNPLSTDVERLCRVCRAETNIELDAVAFVLKEFFELTDDGYFHERIQQEIDIAKSFAEKASKAGHASAAKRQLEANSKATSVETENQPQVHRSQSQSHTQEQRKKEIAANAVLPDWLPKESWEGFKEMRRNSRYPLKGRSETLALNELAKLRDDGHDPAAVLDHSTMKGYRGLFPPPQAGTISQTKPRELRYPSDSPMIDTSKITMPER